MPRASQFSIGAPAPVGTTSPQFRLCFPTGSDARATSFFTPGDESGWLGRTPPLLPLLPLLLWSHLLKQLLSLRVLHRWLLVLLWLSQETAWLWTPRLLLQFRGTSWDLSLVVWTRLLPLESTACGRSAQMRIAANGGKHLARASYRRAGLTRLAPTRTQRGYQRLVAIWKKTFFLRTRKNPHHPRTRWTRRSGQISVVTGWMQ
jgi:hypothetical protein